jgi:hypothetical protein
VSEFALLLIALSAIAIPMLLAGWLLGRPERRSKRPKNRDTMRP